MTGSYGREVLYDFKSTKESNMDENERLAFKMLTIFANNCGYENIGLYKWEDDVSSYFTLILVHEIEKDWPQIPADVIDADALKMILQNILHQIKIISYIQPKAIMMSFYEY